MAVLRLGLKGPADSDAVFNFLLHCRKIEMMSNLRGPFPLSLDCNGSEVINCNSVVVDRYIVSFDMTDRCCFWKMVLCWFGLLGRFAWSELICCFNAEYRSYAVSTLGVSSPEVSSGGCELTRLWMRCRVDPRGLARLSCLGSS